MTVLTTGSESTSITTEVTSESPETTNNPSYAPVATTTDLIYVTTTDLTNITSYPTTGQTTTMYDPITNTTTSDLTNTTYYPNATTTTTNITYNPTTDLPDTSYYSIITVTTDSINKTEYFNTTSFTTDLTSGTNYPSTTTTVDLTNTAYEPNTGPTDGNTPTSIPTHSTPYPNNSTTTDPFSTTTTDPFNTTTTTIDPFTTTTTTDPFTTTVPFTTTTTDPFTTTTTTTTTTPPTTTPLVCANGWNSLNGVCICPDEWFGETCSEKSFCQAQTLDRFTFPRTPIGWFAYSKEICRKGTSGAGKPRASTRCSTNNGSQSFNRPPQVLQCDQTLSDIQQNLTSPANLEMLASSTQILTSKPEELTPENVTAAAQIANTLLLSPNATESVRVAAVATISQLLNANTPDDSKENSATLDLTMTLDQLSVNLSQSLNTNQSKVVQPNLVVQSAQIPAAGTQGVQFTSLSGPSGSFLANRILLYTNTSTAVVENRFQANGLIYVRFSPEAVSGRQKPSNVSLGFVLYQNDRFFSSKRYRRGRATIRVLSASVKGQERSVVPQHVEMLFRPALSEKL
ncbi:mucin-2-like isoform X2 [Siniperca chuatsi]|uniref:mucin-2-like isoform X2 n=1 Tax=Siniperca chuatsi TaxID=119488 RepID=UPI001CE1EC00|nr:mucin-2-like isoform X2 [Siniperca chuatsi]